MNRICLIVLTVACALHSWSQRGSQDEGWGLSDNGTYSVVYDSSDVTHTIVFDSLSYFEVFTESSYSTEAYISWGDVKTTDDSILFLPRHRLSEREDSNFVRLNMVATFRDRQPYIMTRPMVRGITKQSDGALCRMEPEHPEVMSCDFATLANGMDDQLVFVRNGIYTLTPANFSHANEALYSGGIVTESFPTKNQRLISVFCGLFSLHVEIKPGERIQANTFLAKDQLDSLIRTGSTTVYVQAHTRW